MISRRSRKPFPRNCLPLLVLIASLLSIQTMAASPSYGQANSTTASTPAQRPTPTATPVPGADVHIRHERGLAEYERVVQDGTDLVQSSAAALGGTQGGLHITIDDARAVYGKRALGDLAGARAYRFRHYVDPNGLSMPDHSEITLAQLRRVSTRVETRLQYAASCYRLYVRYVDDNGTWRSLPTAFISDSGHYIEVLVEFASGPRARDGRITYWIDDLAIGQHTNLDLYDKFRRPDHLRLGAPWVSDPTTRGTLYVDEFVLRHHAKYIGPEDTRLTVPDSKPALASAPPMHWR
jgi:hypothetical protein